MRICFLGTGASEGLPALFCNCNNCKEAKRLGGKNIRTRSQMLINDDLLVDFPADTYFHKIREELDLSKVRYLLVTHSHPDHFYPWDLFERKENSAKELIEPILNIYCSPMIKERFNWAAKGDPLRSEINGIKWNVVSEFAYVPTERYEIWSLKARHMIKTSESRYTDWVKKEPDAARLSENALFYLIKQGDKAFLQCNDTGCLFEENYEFLSSLGVKIDAIALDSTRGKAEDVDFSGHMTINQVIKTVERMRKSNFVKPTTRFIATHFSHNGGLMQDDYEKIYDPYGIEVAYDGFCIHI